MFGIGRATTGKTRAVGGCWGSCVCPHERLFSNAVDLKQQLCSIMVWPSPAKDMYLQKNPIKIDCLIGYVNFRRKYKYTIK